MSDQERYSDPAEIRHVIGGHGTLTLQGISGQIELRATDRDEVTVIARSEHGHGEPLPLVVRRMEGGLHIEMEKRSAEGFGGWFRNRGGIEFEVSVPRRARVDVSTVSADIAARFLAGEQAYKTVSGDIEVDPDGGRVSITTVSGDIEVRAAEPAELRIVSTSGDVNVQGAVISALDARTVSGDIEFEAGLAPGPLHTIETVSGDVSIESSTGVTVDVKRSMDLGRGGSGPLVAGDGAAQLRVRTLSGDCHVTGARREERDDRRDRHGRRWERLNVAPPAVPAMPPLPRMPPMPPMPPTPPTKSDERTGEPEYDQIEVLRALERGEIDVDEAQRRLQEA